MQLEAKTKEPINTAEPSPVEQWDQVAFKLIHQELAPKGYSEIKRGPWRGKVQSNIPFLPKQTVLNCQKISAQLIRTFRSKAVKEIRTITEDIEKWTAEDEQKLAACYFWQLAKKSELKYKIRSLRGQAGSALNILRILETLPIK